MREKITKLVIIIMTITICGLMVVFDKVHAATITNWSTTQTRYWYDDHGTITNSGSWQTNPQTWSPTLPVARIQYRLKIPEAFKPDTNYTFKVGWKSTPDSLAIDEIYTNFAGDDPTYSQHTCTDAKLDDNGYWWTSCTTTPNTEIASGSYFYVAIHFHESYVSSLSSYIKGYTQQLGIGAVVENQTNKINDTLEDIKDLNHNYNNNPSESVSNNNITEAENKENQLLESIDLSGTENITIPINPNASSFIWNIVEQLRGLNNKIVMLMTAILGLGIIKMILNR